ncbi:hypothetical protein PT974_12048 [Cladobotryum mycophilum]|uniref:CHY-type domain-containing protein n=1 Tax=Cladobotryum mycophilum TaxID=491253 RepID=A0ABR0S6Y4_9HYPO
MIALKTQTDGSPLDRNQAVGEPSAARVVPKPVPEAQLQDPRSYQIEQLRRRFSPKESTAPSGATSLVFRLKPSDPDFPFELAYLDCDIRVPEGYPEERPELLVRNKDIPRGFSINVERGFERLAEEKKGSTILALVHALDRNLERFLSEQKVETIKLVAFKDTRHLDAEVGKGKSVVEPAKSPQPMQSAPPPRVYIPEPSYSREQINEAKARRAQEIRQLESRMGRMPQFRRSADGVIFTLPIEPKRRGDLPSGLQSVNTIHLIIPLLYPLQQLRIQLNEADASDAEPVEDLFAEKAAEQKQMNLMTHVNYLAQNLHNLAKQARTLATKVETPQAPNAPQQQQQDEDKGSVDPSESLEGKGYVQIIQRPPEWVLVGEEEEEEDSDDFSDLEDEDGGVVLDKEAEATPAPQPEVEHGTMISFPSVELHSIELLQVSILSISVKCERCKTLNDITGLKPGVEKSASCKKCAIPFIAKFSQHLVHEHSARAGFIDLSGCKVADMLPSTFVPTCAKCSTASPGFVSVRGESTTNVCRECHGKFTFKIPEVKFLFISPGSLPPPAATGLRRKQEKLGLHAGDPLPGRGACEHYRKSYRWFRFSCCSRVHPCDKCHDRAEDHINEWANRMICGWCSREQNYSVEACGFCGRSVIGRKGKGFWEGGKGTRDQRMMSRKDPRKYKRLGPSAGAKKE